LEAKEPRQKAQVDLVLPHGWMVYSVDDATIDMAFDRIEVIFRK
jgi:hypothetical protein